jgi:hypothetical protein
VSILWSLVEKIVDLVMPAVLDRRRLRFTVHRAAFLDSAREAFFFNLTNLARSREVEVTHVWVECSPPVPALQDARPLPKRLKPDETWETWIYADEIPPGARGDVMVLSRARLSTGQVLKAKENRDVPPFGAVPGGPARDLATEDPPTMTVIAAEPESQAKLRAILPWKDKYVQNS